METADEATKQPLTLAAAAEALRTGATTSVALTQQCLRKIERWEPVLRACVTVMAESALAQAEAADAARREQPRRGPLFGLPLGIKDLIATRGVRTTAGSRVLDDWLPEIDAAVVARLQAAGAIALCKTNTHEFAFGTVTAPTRNPWDTERIPGGSSGGSAAAVATGECLGALGSDTGGSIRIPAAACGVTGLKPTYGVVSRAGIVPLSWSYDHAGPIARSVEDCALLLDVLAGYDADDPASIDVPLLDFATALATKRGPEDAVRGTRIGVPTNYFFRSIDHAVEATVRAAIAQYERLGAEVREVTVPETIDEMFAVYRAVMRPEAYSYHQEQGWLDSRAERYSPAVLANIRLGADYSAVDYIRAQQARQHFTTQMRALLRSVDVLLTPTLPIPAQRVDALETPLLFDGREEPAGHALRYTFPFNLTGQPALSLPCGFTPDRLPVGLQLVAGHFGETTLLRLGHAYQRVTDWHLRQPPAPPAVVE